MISIRPLLNEDLDKATQLIWRVTRGLKDAGLDQWDETYPAREDIAKDIEEGSILGLFQGENLDALGVLNQHQDAEYRTVTWTMIPNDPRNVGVIHRLCVDPECQGKGLGRIMLGALENRARTLGFEALRLDAFAHNPGADSFYTRADYRKAGSVIFRKGKFYCYEKWLRD